MNDAGKAVFLSYASQDAEAAKKICDALRAAGVEVWFDQSELVGGDVWDTKIRGQIGSCGLFVPVISANTQARLEGYFRLEWKIAALRTHTMAEEKTFLLPVLVDGTRDAEARVPAEFKTVQWTKLPDGETSAAFATRVKKLLSGEPLDAGQGRPSDLAQRRPQAAGPEARAEHREARTGNAKRPGRKTYAWLGAAVVALTAAGWWFLGGARATHSPAPAAATPAAPLSEAKQKLAQAQAMMAREDYLNRANLEAVEEVLQRVLTLDPTEADAWALVARVDSYMYRQGYDSSEARRQLAFNHAGKAISLAPEGWDSRLAKALVLRVAGKTPATLVEAEEIYRTLLRERPDDPTALKEAAYLLKDAGKPAEAARLVERMGDLVSAGWYYAAAGEFAEARRIVDGELAKARTAPMLKLKIYVETMGYEDLAAARAASARFTGTELLDDEFLAEALRLAMFRRDSAEMLRLLNAYPREAIAASTFEGSKREFTGMAHHFAGREEIARSEWRLALEQAREKSQATGSEPRWLYKAAMLHAWLGETAEAQEALERARGLQGLAADSDDNLESVAVEIVLGRREAAVANLERNQAKGRPAHAYARFLWIFDPLRGDPRFEQFLRDHLPPAAKPFDDPKPQTLNPGPADRPAVDQKSVAVLAFANLSDDKANEYFSDGISEELLNVLAKITGLKVAARTSAFYFKGKEVPIPEIAKQLGVAYVVEGSVRKSGDKVRITAQLIKASDGFHVWSDTFTRDIKDVFAVQDEIAGLIAQQLQLKLAEEPARDQSVNPEAHQLYLQGRYFANQPSTDNLAKAVDFLQRAVDLDPTFAPAWGALARNVALQAEYLETTPESLRERFARARRAADRAIALAPKLSDGYFARFEIQTAYDYDWRGARESLDLALALAPADALLVSNAGQLATFFADFPRSLVLGRRAAELDPVNAEIRYWLGRTYVCAGLLAEGEAELRRAVELSPSLLSVHRQLSTVLALQGRAAEAVTEARLEKDEWSRQASLVVACWAAKDVPAADVALARLIEVASDSAAYQVAEGYAFRGESDKAFEWLDRAYRNRDSGFGQVRADPLLKSLRGDPRWALLLKQAGLADEQLK